MAKYFSAHFDKIVFSISHYKMVIRFNVLQQTAYLVVNPIMAGNFAFFFNYMLAGRTSDSMTVAIYVWFA